MKKMIIIVDSKQVFVKLFVGNCINLASSSSKMASGRRNCLSGLIKEVGQNNSKRQSND